MEFPEVTGGKNRYCGTKKNMKDESSGIKAKQVGKKTAATEQDIA
jgi:hypothetical protein